MIVFKPQILTQLDDRSRQKIDSAIDRAQVFLNDGFDNQAEINIFFCKPFDITLAIPEDNIGGRAYFGNMIFIVSDDFDKVSEDILFEIICHESSHALRYWFLPEYSYTLLDTMILEGLAICLEKEAMKNSYNRQFFLKTMLKTSDDEMVDIYNLIKGNFDSTDSDYINKVLFDGDENIPRWAGYKLGYYIANKYLEKNNKTIFEANFDSYKKFSSFSEKLFGFSRRE